MKESEALERIVRLIHEVSGKKVEVSLAHDLREDDLLDSLDTMIFFMELEKQTGVSVPETENIVEDGWYKVSKLCAELIATNSKKE